MAQGWQAGVRAGEQVHFSALEHRLQPGPCRWVSQGGDVETPARQRIGVAVHHADATTGDLVAREHRQLRDAMAQSLVATCRFLQLAMDLVRPVDDGAVHAVRVGAATAGVVGGRVELGFDVAEDGVVGQHPKVDLGELAVGHVEPVEVAVEAQDRRLASMGIHPRHQLDGVARWAVAVQTAHDVERRHLSHGDLGQCLRAVAVADRTDAARGGVSHFSMPRNCPGIGILIATHAHSAGAAAVFTNEEAAAPATRRPAPATRSQPCTTLPETARRVRGIAVHTRPHRRPRPAHRHRHRPVRGGGAPGP